MSRAVLNRRLQETESRFAPLVAEMRQRAAALGIDPRDRSARSHLVTALPSALAMAMQGRR